MIPIPLTHQTYQTDIILTPSVLLIYMPIRKLPPGEPICRNEILTIHSSNLTPASIIVLYTFPATLTGIPNLAASVFARAIICAFRAGTLTDERVGLKRVASRTYAALLGERGM